MCIHVNTEHINNLHFNNKKTNISIKKQAKEKDLDTL